MTRISAFMEVEAPQEEVWKVVSDPRNLPRWDRHITKVVGVPDEGLEPGTEYTTVVTFMGVNAHVDAEVLEIKPPEFSEIRLSGPLMEGVVTTRVSSLGDRRSRLQQDVDYRLRGGPLGRVASKALELTGGPQIALRHGVLAQKQQVERD